MRTRAERPGKPWFSRKLCVVVRLGWEILVLGNPFDQVAGALLVVVAGDVCLGEHAD